MRRIVFLFLLTVLVASTGCRNRCGSGCNGWFAGSQRVAAPPTYSLNIPSMAGNQPYYVPGQNGTARTAALNTSAAAPTPAFNQNTSTANLNGWRPVNDNSGATNNPNTNGTSVLTQPTTFAQNGTNVPPGYRTASNTALPGSGRSFTDQTNYQTTRVNEAQDPSRVPVTDATTVRAPARNNPTGAPTRFAQIPPNSNGARYSGTLNVPASGGQPIYSANPVIAGNTGFGRTPVYMGQPMVGQQFAVNPTTTIQAQSTTTANTNTQVGWRDRETSSDAFSR